MTGTAVHAAFSRVRPAGRSPPRGALALQMHAPGVHRAVDEAVRLFEDRARFPVGIRYFAIPFPAPRQEGFSARVGRDGMDRAEVALLHREHEVGLADHLRGDLPRDMPL